jgi:hypothetical protein
MVIWIVVSGAPRVVTIGTGAGDGVGATTTADKIRENTDVAAPNTRGEGDHPGIR